MPVNKTAQGVEIPTKKVMVGLRNGKCAYWWEWEEVD